MCSGADRLSLTAAEDKERGYLLVVSEREVNQLALEATFRNAGFEAASATVEEVLALHDLVPPKLVILDDATDRGARKELQKQLGRHPRLIGVPLLVLARDGDMDSFSEAIAGGAAAYLKKPASAAELTELAVRLSGWSGRGDWTEKRRRIRRPLILQIHVQRRSDRVRQRGQMLDASSGGCRVEVTQDVTPGEKVQVILHAETPDTEGEDSTYLGLGAQVRWSRQIEAGRFELGLRFTGTTAILAGKILGFTPVGGT